jgi:hypothetical protein
MVAFRIGGPHSGEAVPVLRAQTSLDKFAAPNVALGVKFSRSLRQVVSKSAFVGRFGDPVHRHPAFPTFFDALNGTAVASSTGGHRRDRPPARHVSGRAFGSARGALQSVRRAPSARLTIDAISSPF